METSVNTGGQWYACGGCKTDLLVNYTDSWGEICYRRVRLAYATLLVVL